MLRRLHGRKGRATAKFERLWALADMAPPTHRLDGHPQQLGDFGRHHESLVALHQIVSIVGIGRCSDSTSSTSTRTSRGPNRYPRRPLVYVPTDGSLAAAGEVDSLFDGRDARGYLRGSCWFGHGRTIVAISWPSPRRRRRRARARRSPCDQGLTNSAEQFAAEHEHRPWTFPDASRMGTMTGRIAAKPRCPYADR
jgi:hypothetical protein